MAVPSARPAVAAPTQPTLITESPAAARPPLRCEPPALGRDRLFLSCALAQTAPYRVLVRVHFTGSHDDTNASMQVAIDDQPVDCDPGSKTHTEAEDGDVTIHCAFTVPARSGAQTVLRASARWFHAQYVKLDIDADQH